MDMNRELQSAALAPSQIPFAIYSFHKFARRDLLFPRARGLPAAAVDLLMPISEVRLARVYHPGGGFAMYPLTSPSADAHGLAC